MKSESAKENVKTRTLIIIGIIFAVGITFTLFYIISIRPTCIEGTNLDGTCNEPMRLPLSVHEYGKQKTCEEMGGTWNADHCLITQETFELKYQGYCDEGLTYSPSLHVCLGNDSSVQHVPLKDPPRTAPPEPENEN